MMQVEYFTYLTA